MMRSVTVIMHLAFFVWAFDHFKKFAQKGKFFEMLSWGCLGGRSPSRNLRYPPSVRPKTFVRKDFSSKFFRQNFFVRIFSSELFLSVVGPSSPPDYWHY